MITNLNLIEGYKLPWLSDVCKITFLLRQNKQTVHHLILFLILKHRALILHRLFGLAGFKINGYCCVVINVNCFEVFTAIESSRAPAAPVVWMQGMITAPSAHSLGLYLVFFKARFLVDHVLNAVQTSLDHFYGTVWRAGLSLCFQDKIFLITTST